MSRGRSKRGGTNGIPKDRGCSYAPSCLHCPFVQCRYDLAHGESMQYRRDSIPADVQARVERNLAILARSRHPSVAIDQLAGEFKLSRRQVFRILADSEVA